MARLESPWLCFPQEQPAGKVKWRLFFFPLRVLARALCLHRARKSLHCSARLPSPWISQGWDCKETMLLTQIGSGQKLLTIFCWTKRGERNTAHSHSCRSLSRTWKSREENGIREGVLLTQPLPSGSHRDDKIDFSQAFHT